jgi:hypothetical protein
VSFELIIASGLTFSLLRPAARVLTTNVIQVVTGSKSAVFPPTLHCTPLIIEGCRNLVYGELVVSTQRTREILVVYIVASLMARVQKLE